MSARDNRRRKARARRRMKAWEERRIDLVSLALCADSALAFSDSLGVASMAGFAVWDAMLSTVKVMHAGSRRRLIGHVLHGAVKGETVAVEMKP